MDCHTDFFDSIGIAPTLIPAFLGTEFANSVPIMQILSLTIILIAVSNVTGVQYLLAVRRQKDFSKSVTSGAVVNLLLNLILIPELGACGAAIASVIAEVIVAGRQIVMLRKDVAVSHQVISNIVGMLGVILIETRSCRDKEKKQDGNIQRNKEALWMLPSAFCCCACSGKTT